MKWYLLYILCLATISNTFSKPLGTLFNSIVGGKERKVRVLLKTPINTNEPRGNQTALTVALRSLGEEMLLYETLTKKQTEPYSDVIKPAVAFVVSKILFGEPLKEEDFFEHSEETNNHTTEHEYAINSDFSTGNIKKINAPKTVRIETTKKNLDPLKKRALILLSYSPWLIGGLWLLPALWENAKVTKQKISRYFSLKKQYNNVQQHYRIVHTVLNHAKTRMTKKSENLALSIIKDYQKQVQLRPHAQLLFELEQELYDMEIEG